MENKLKRNSNLFTYIFAALVNFLASAIFFIIALINAKDLGETSVLVSGIVAATVYVATFILSMVFYSKANKLGSENKDRSKLAYKLGWFLWMTPIPFIFAIYAYRSSGPSNKEVNLAKDLYKMNRSVMSLELDENKSLLAENKKAHDKIVDAIELHEDNHITRLERDSFVYDTLMEIDGFVNEPDIYNDPETAEWIYETIQKRK